MERITVWRLVEKRFAADAYSGVGAKISSGRFNSVGRKMVYTSESISLAILELLVQSRDRAWLQDNCMCVSASFENSLVTAKEHEDLPSGWDIRPDWLVSRSVGDLWLQEQSSAVLRVPSVVVPLEHNFLINPLHPDFSQVEIGEPMKLPFDDRLVG